MILEPVEQLWRDEEVLARMLAAGNVHHTFVYHPLVAWIHALIDLVYHPEGRSSQGLQRHEVEDG